MGAPSGPMRNFSKFQAMSVLLTGRQIRNWGFAIRLSGSSLGAGRDFFRNLNTGCSFSPLASTYQPRHFMSSHFKQEKVLPCQTILLWTETHFQAWHASEHWQFLVLQNFLGGQTNICYILNWRARYIYWFPHHFTWFVGKARTANFPENYKTNELYFVCRHLIIYINANVTFSQSSFICVKSLVVVPHKEAVFSTSTTLPLYLSILTTSPARVRADSAWNPAIYLIWFV